MMQDMYATLVRCLSHNVLMDEVAANRAMKHRVTWAPLTVDIASRVRDLHGHLQLGRGDLGDMLADKVLEGSH